MRTRIIILALIAVLLLVFISAHSDPGRVPTLPERIALEAVGSLGAALTATTRSIENLWTGYFYLVELRQENENLKTALARMKRKIADYEEDQKTSRRLSKLLVFASKFDQKSIGANVVAWDPGPWFKTITINRGSADGLAIGMPVVNELGVVGRVMEAAPHFARVLLVIDYNSSVDALVQRTRNRGLLSGRSENYCLMQYIRKTDDVQKGDVIVTSGMSGSFPRGLPIGTVSKVTKTGQNMFLNIEVTPSVDFTRLEDVLVILTKQPTF